MGSIPVRVTTKQKPCRDVGLFLFPGLFKKHRTGIEQPGPAALRPGGQKSPSGAFFRARVDGPRTGHQHRKLCKKRRAFSFSWTFQKAPYGNRTAREFLNPPTRPLDVPPGACGPAPRGGSKRKPVSSNPAAAPGRVYTHVSITARPFFEKRGYCVRKEQQVERCGELLTNFVMETAGVTVSHGLKIKKLGTGIFRIC